MPDTSVKVFRSTDAGAPSVSYAAGAWISLLNACLVDGYGTVTVSPLVVSGNVATGTVSAGHGFSMLGNTGPVISISGATPSALNGVWRVASVPNSTTFTFATSGISDQTATGTITAKRTPAGWTKPYSGTNKAVYAPSGQGATGAVMRVLDTASDIARVRGYASMTDVDTGTDPFPTVAQSADGALPGWEHPSTSWIVAADSLAMVAVHQYSTWYGVVIFGDFVPAIPTDVYACFLAGGHAASPYVSLTLGGVPSLNRWVMRGADQVSKSVQCSLMGAMLPVVQTQPGASGTAYPYPATGVGGILLAPIGINDGMFRGYLPGVFQPLHSLPGTDGDLQAAIIGGVVRDIVLKTQSLTGNYNGSRIAIDITGPWR